MAMYTKTRPANLNQSLLTQLLNAMPGGSMPSSREWWVVSLGIIFIIAGLRFLPDAFTSIINAVGVALWIATGVGIIVTRRWIARYVRE
jgi:uncharacterized membrane protein HdeD (DUF308 family)